MYLCVTLSLKVLFIPFHLSQRCEGMGDCSINTVAPAVGAGVPTLVH